MNDHIKTIPLKQAEVSVHRFNDMAIPHHVGLLNNHRSNIEKSLALGDWNKIRKEEINATRVIKQMKNLFIEMDSLRDKLPTKEDQIKYDAMLDKGKQKALASMKQYIELQLKSPGKMSRKRNNSTGLYMSDDDDDNDDMENDAIVEIGSTRAHQNTLPKFEIDFKKEEYDLAQRQACLDELEALQRDIRDLNGMFHNMNEMVHEQAKSVEAIADNAEEAVENVRAGEENLKRALGYKKVMYPVMGALLGTCMGGPIGMVAGLKVGGLAAVSCGILGFTGGSVLKGNPAIMQGGIIEEVDCNGDTTNTMEMSASTTARSREQE